MLASLETTPELRRTERLISVSIDAQGGDSEIR